MAKYNVQSYENAKGTKVDVYYKANKHRHDAALITKIEKWLGETKTGQWSSRGNYRSSQPLPTGKNAVEYTG